VRVEPRRIDCIDGFGVILALAAFDD
jgi:hypothetical protein